MKQDKTATEKFKDAFDAYKAEHNVDPRGGGHSFVCQAEFAAQVLKDTPTILVQLPAPVIVGDGGDADVVARVQGVPIRIRDHAKAGNIWLINDRMLPRSTQKERRAAGQLRMMAHAGQLQRD